MRKPKWLNKKIDINKCREVASLMGELKLNTICKEASCPNISECFNKKIATFLILGDICTRNCKFCGVQKGEPLKVDKKENQRVLEAIKKLGLKYVVITSVTRDDLKDGGAKNFADIIKQLKEKIPQIKIEVLVPDFKGNEKDIEKVVKAQPDIFSHNIETISRLYPQVRQMADYKLSLSVLQKAKDIAPYIKTKTGIMLGLGETQVQVLEALDDLRKVNCDFISIGQYLPPSTTHYKVQEYITPEMFDFYKEQAIQKGFKHVESAPYVRSSYMADRYLG
ncbi:MAG: lipoyl synthase [Candidatus Omnitrophica bacterium]|nr:lipoyl synthase [Candidatus Omnitrophota bacterium]